MIPVQDNGTFDSKDLHVSFVQYNRITEGITLMQRKTIEELVKREFISKDSL